MLCELFKSHFTSFKDILDILERLGSFPKNLILFMVVVVVLHPYILKLNTTYYK